MRVGKLFHLTHFVADLPAADAFFEAVFEPVCWHRGYMELYHRQASLLSVAEYVIEPFQPLPPRPGTADPTTFRRYLDRFGPRVHSLAFYVDGHEEIAERLRRHGIRTTAGGLQQAVFPHPKDWPGMLELIATPDPATSLDPRFDEAWDDRAWRARGLGIVRCSHTTAVVRDHRRAAELYADVLDGVVLPDQPARAPGAASSFVALGTDAVVELAQPTDPEGWLAAELRTVGECWVGATFLVGDLPPATAHLDRAGVPWAAEGDATVTIDRVASFSTAYSFTTERLLGDGRRG
jgi:hypothetical protein